jgi:hypothetical protein
MSRWVIMLGPSHAREAAPYQRGAMEDPPPPLWRRAWRSVWGWLGPALAIGILAFIAFLFQD